MQYWILKTCNVSLNVKPNGLELNELILKVKIKKIIMRVWFADNCSLAVFLLNIDNPAPSIIIFGILSILFIALVGLDKLIVFRKVLGMERMVCQTGQIQPGPVNHQEYMLTMKKFSTSDIHFKMTIYIPLTLLGLGLLLFKNIYSVILQDSIAVSKSSKSTWINFSPRSQHIFVSRWVLCGRQLHLQLSFGDQSWFRLTLWSVWENGGRIWTGETQQLWMVGDKRVNQNSLN